MRRSYSLISECKSVLAVSFIICAASFICGTFFGTAYSISSSFSDKSIGFLYDILKDGSSDAGSGFLRALPLILFSFFSLIFSCSIFGVITVPFFSFAYAFTVAFMIASAARILGDDKAVNIFCLFGSVQLFAIPCFMIYSSNSLASSIGLLQTLAEGRDTRLRLCFFSRRIMVAVLVTLLAVVIFEAYFKLSFIRLIL